MFKFLKNVVIQPVSADFYINYITLIETRVLTGAIKVYNSAEKLQLNNLFKNS